MYYIGTLAKHYSGYCAFRLKTIYICEWICLFCFQLQTPQFVGATGVNLTFVLVLWYTKKNWHTPPFRNANNEGQRVSKSVFKFIKRDEGIFIFILKIQVIKLRTFHQQASNSDRRLEFGVVFIAKVLHWIAGVHVVMSTPSLCLSKKVCKHTKNERTLQCLLPL